MKKILLVDDEKDTAAVFETALKQGGYEVTVVNNGNSAISTAKANAFDLILMDQMMPDISGIDALSTLKSDTATSKVPIAMLTNFSHDEMVKEALNRGAADYILKYQVSPQDLISKVKAILGES
jgi:CheY-like chemotaxis protein